MLSLDGFRTELNYHPYHFWQLADAHRAPVTSACNDLVFEYGWQATDAVSRDEIRRAIVSASLQLQQYLGFAVGARPFAQQVRFPRSGVVQLRDEGYVQTLGTVTDTIIATLPITVSDDDGDGLLDTFHGTATISPMPAGTLSLAVPPLDRAGNHDDWAIHPATIDHASGVVAVRGPAWLIVQPSLYAASFREPRPTIAANNAASYLTHLALVERTITPYPDMQILDARLGLIGRVESCQPIRCGDGDAPVLVTGIAGWERTPDGGLSDPWQRVVAQFAVAELSGMPCACESANRWTAYWQADVSRSQEGETFAFRRRAINNPFGSRRGHIEAYQTASRYMIGRGIGGRP